MNNLKNVIFFVTSLQSGGIENYLLRFLKEKHQEFAEITVYCKGGFGGQLEQEYLGVPNVQVIKRHIGFLNPLAYYQLVGFLRKKRIDVVCDFTGNFAGLVIYSAKIARIKKRVTFYRGSSDHFGSSSLKKIYNSWVHRLTKKYSTDILANSKSALDFFFEKEWQGDRRFEVVYNGINPSEFVEETQGLRNELGIPLKAFVVGHTGRFNSAKNHETILKVAEDLTNQYEDVYFIMCGNGVEKNLKNRISDKKLNSKIFVFENRRDIPKFLNTMDCYYFPSITEGQPNALLEAMLMNKTIVASNIDSIKETVPEYMFEFLVDPLDTKAAKQKILDIYNERPKIMLSNWVITNFNSTRLFQQFHNRLKCQ